MIPGACDRRGRTREGYRFPRRVHRRWLVLGFLVVSVLGVVGCERASDGAEFPPSLDSLIALEPSSTARFSRAGLVPAPPLRSSILGFGSNRSTLRVRLSSDVERELEAVPESARLHASGIYQAISGDLDEAILLLDGAVLREPSRADVRTDLAVAHLLRQEKTGNIRDLFDAVRASKRALAIDPGHAAAAFNLAEALTRLPLVRHGGAAWDRFLEVESTGKWAQHARDRQKWLSETSEAARWERAKRAVLTQWQRRRAVPENAVVEFPQRFREWVLKTVLPAWARAQQREDARFADERLGLARSVGESLAGSTEDHLVADAVAGIDRIVREEDPVALSEVSTAVIALARGLVSFERQQYAAMRRDLAAAEETLRHLDNPLWGIAAYYRTAVASHADPATTVGGLLEILRSLPIDRYPQLRGYCELMIGSVEAATGDAERGLEQFDLARRFLDRSAPDVAGRVVGPFRGDALRLLGRNDEALSVYVEGVAKSAFSGHPRHYGVALYTLVELLIEEGDGEAALPVAEEMVANASGHRLPPLSGEAYLQRGRVHHLLGLADAAVADLAEAERWAQQMPKDDLRVRIASVVDLAAAQVLNTRDPHDALRRMNRLLETRLERGYLYRLPVVLLERSRAYGALGRADLREGDLVAALGEADRLRGEAKQPRYRRSAFTQAREIVEEMIAFQLDSRHDPVAAFEYAELGRARELSHALGRSSGTVDEASLWTAHLDDIQTSLPEDVVLVEYAALPDRLLIWKLDRGGIDLHVTKIERSEVLDRVRALRGALDRRAGSSGVLEAAADVHDLLLKDILATIPPDAPLVIVPDRSLADVPFGALYDRTTGRYVIEDRAVAGAPSARVYAAATARSADPASAPTSVLAVGDPRSSPKIGLPRLPRAANEARQIGSAFPMATVLTEENATKAAVVAELSRHPVAYFATHAFVDPHEPERSAIVLAGEDKEGGRLTADEIRRLDLRGVRLVVLPVCEAMQGREHGDEGLTGLVAAFLEAGVSAVVAPTRPVSDDSTGWLMEFARSVAVGEEVGSAFRRAQANAISILHDSEWSSFQLIGRLSRTPGNAGFSSIARSEEAGSMNVQLKRGSNHGTIRF